MRAWWGAALICMVMGGCGDASPSATPRFGAGGGGGARIDLPCDCALGEECSDDGRCVSICGDVAACAFGGTAQCCAAGTVCRDGSCVTDCGGNAECNGVCCDSAEMCLEGSCVLQCPDPGQLCGDDGELCCASDEACVGGGCAPLRGECTFGEDCEIDELCEQSLGVCIPREAVDDYRGDYWFDSNYMMGEGA